MKPLTEEHLAIFRRHMVEVIDVNFDIMGDEIGDGALDPAVRAAFLHVPRHHFVPARLALLAYQDAPLPIGFDKTISQPFIAALMIHLLAPAKGDRVLEVGTGLGYQAAILAELGANVFSVEIVEEFVEEAQVRLERSGYPGIAIRVGDGSRGWADHAPFDRILVSAATDEPPSALANQLRPGGRMVIPLGDKESQILTLIEKSADGQLDRRAVMPVRFTRLESMA